MGSWYPAWIHPTPQGPQLDVVLKQYELLGFPGCCGSTDCVHVPWNACPQGERHLFYSRYGYPSVAYSVTVDHSRRILSVTAGHPGSRTDKTIIQYQEWREEDDLDEFNVPTTLDSRAAYNPTHCSWLGSDGGAERDEGAASDGGAACDGRAACNRGVARDGGAARNGGVALDGGAARDGEAALYGGVARDRGAARRSGARWWSGAQWRSGA